MNGLTYAGLCWKCKCQVAIPADLFAAAKRDDRITFYCAHGHPAAFSAQETEADKLRRERDLLAQRIAQRDDEIAAQRRMRETAERQASAARGQVTRLKNRAAAGVCPCCNRTVTQMARHMATKHPQFRAEIA